MNKSADNNKLLYLSKECFDCLKGYFALCVLFHHLYQFTGLFVGTKIEMIFKYLGYYSVAIFMFISGFGLYESFSTKGDEYIRKFPFKRIFPFYFVYSILSVIYIVYDLCLGITHNISEILHTFTYGGTVISFGWYLQLNLFMYVIFYLVFRLIKINKLRLIFIALITVAYYVFELINKTPEYLYTPVILFIFGIICSKYKFVLDKILSKLHIVIFILSFSLFSAGLIFIRRYLYFVNEYVAPLIYTASGIFFVVFIVTSLRFLMKYAKVFVINPVSRFYGIISLEIYAFQGIILRSLSLIGLNKYLYIVLAIIGCTLIAIPFNRLFVLLQKKIFKK